MYILYRTLEEIVKITNAEPFIYSDLGKRYRYTNSEIAVTDGEYIFVPMSYTGLDMYDLIENHLKNPYCKGFFISKKHTSDEKFIKILNKYSPKNVFVVRNAYNTGFDIARTNAQTFNPELIIVAGTDGAKEVKDKLCYNLNVENLPYESHWQKVIDPLLRYREGEKFVILETDLDKKTSDHLASYNTNSIIVYTKASIKLLVLYQTREEYLIEWAKLAQNKPKAIFAREDNDFLYLSGLDDKIHYTENPADDVLKYFGINDIKEVPKKRNVNKFIDSTNSLYSIKKSIRDFISNKSLKNKRKIIIFQAINWLNKLAYQTHSEILSEITEEIDSLAFICGAVYTTELSNKNHKTVIKRVPYVSEDNLLSIKKFIEWRSKGADCAYLIIGGDKDVCSIV